MIRPALLLPAAVVAGTLLVAPLALAQPGPPSVVQLCAATSVDEVDALLDAVAESGLVGDLAPLVSITVPEDADSVELDAAVDLDDVRSALDCAEPDPTPTPSPSPTPTPSPSPTPTGTAPPPPPVTDEFDCADFATQAEAQATLDEDVAGDPHRLDEDGDGTACEVDVPDSGGQVSRLPIGSVATGGWPTG